MQFCCYLGQILLSLRKGEGGGGERVPNKPTAVDAVTVSAAGTVLASHASVRVDPREWSLVLCFVSLFIQFSPFLHSSQFSNILSTFPSHIIICCTNVLYIGLGVLFILRRMLNLLQRQLNSAFYLYCSVAYICMF